MFPLADIFTERNDPPNERRLLLPNRVSVSSQAATSVRDVRLDSH